MGPWTEIKGPGSGGAFRCPQSSKDIFYLAPESEVRALTGGGGGGTEAQARPSWRAVTSLSPPGWRAGSAHPSEIGKFL
jgi:hypothetical protein